MNSLIRMEYDAVSTSLDGWCVLTELLFVVVTRRIKPFVLPHCTYQVKVDVSTVHVSAKLIFPHRND